MTVDPASTVGPADADPAPLVLDPVPSAPAAARRHVRAVVAGLGRPDLLDAAEAGVSELVTNAAIHARTEITVRIRTLAGGGIQIEVADCSAVLPSPRDYGVNSTVGRGLRLLASLGEWGYEPGAGSGRGHGKVVWFRPRAEADEAAFALDPPTGPAAVEGNHRAATRAVLGRYEASGAGRLVTVRLLRFPLRLFAAAREHHDELVRELSLLAMAPADPSVRPLPQRLLDLVEALGGRHRAAAERADAVRDAALARGERSIDLTYQVPVSVRDRMLALERLLDEADRFCRDEHLQTLAETPLQLRFRRWFTGQFVTQIDGGPAEAWTGPLQDTGPRRDRDHDRDRDSPAGAPGPS